MKAPFDADQIAALRAWQECPWVETLTCEYDRCVLPLIPEKRGMVCPECFAEHEEVPDGAMTVPPKPGEPEA